MSFLPQKPKLARETREGSRKWEDESASCVFHSIRDPSRVSRAAYSVGLLFAAFMALVMVTGPLRAQSPGEPNEGSIIEEDVANSIYRFKWWGVGGRTYFLQHSTDLDTWNWLPIIETGDNSVREWGFTLTTDKFFIRLWHSDIPTADPEGADFDTDGLGNMDELLLGTNPLKDDSDGDGLPDGWEVDNGFDPSNRDENNNGVWDGHDDADDDGLSNLEEFLAGSNPRNEDSDQDGLRDGWGRAAFNYDDSGWLSTTPGEEVMLDPAGNVESAGGTP